MRTFWSLLEAALLALTGLTLGWTALGPDYWQLLNPKFAPLTLGAAIGCVLMGLALAWRREASVRPLRVAAFGVFLACLALFLFQGAPLGQADGLFPPPAGLSGDSPPEVEPESPRLELNGREYIRLNTAELCAQADLGRLDPLGPLEPNVGRYVTRGLVLTSPELSAQGIYALVRVQIVCCLADAVAVGVLVRGEPPVGDQEWARVAGRIVFPGDADPDLETPASGLTLPDVLLTFVGASVILEADRAEPIQPPAMPYIFEVRDAEPFAF